MSKLSTTKEVAEFFKVHPTTINRWRKEENPVPFLQVGRHVRFEIEKVVKWLEDKNRS